MSDFLKQLLRAQVEGAISLEKILDENFEIIASVVANCNGHVIISGIGKSGIIGEKISATMSSVGIPSFFLCPFNATHGDIGTIVKHDIIILISNSGNAQELIVINEYCRKNGNVTIGITRATNSYLATETSHSIVLPQMPEGNECDAPATSTTQTLIACDILALLASKVKNFSRIDYAKLHPSGSLGKQISKVTTVIKTEFCTVELDDLIVDITKKMTEYSNGFVCVVKDKKLCGIITDGDIRRAILKSGGEIKDLKAGDICNKSPKFLTKDAYVIDAENIMKNHKIQNVIIVENGVPIGFVKMM